MAQTKKEEKLLEYVIFIAAGYFLIINPILKKLGIKKSELETAPDITPPTNNVWSGQPFLNGYKGKKIRLIPVATKEKYSKTIFDALPTFGNDDSNAIIGVFRSINAKTQVADLAIYFKNKYKYDLFDFLKKGRSKDFFWSSTTSGLNSDNLNTVLKIVNAKPNI